MLLSLFGIINSVGTTVQHLRSLFALLRSPGPLHHPVLDALLLMVDQDNLYSARTTRLTPSAFIEIAGKGAGLLIDSLPQWPLSGREYSFWTSVRVEHFDDAAAAAAAAASLPESHRNNDSSALTRCLHGAGEHFTYPRSLFICMTQSWHGLRVFFADDNVLTVSVIESNGSRSEERLAGHPFVPGVWYVELKKRSPADQQMIGHQLFPYFHIYVLRIPGPIRCIRCIRLHTVAYGGAYGALGVLL